ncbi:MAG: L,D-transpeptidase [Nitrospira sp.]|jgi:L,D-transpeptidase ErfK/SrfK|nr:L,D-transpeptidase [Nitrospira sp.]
MTRFFIILSAVALGLVAILLSSTRSEVQTSPASVTPPPVRDQALLDDLHARYKNVSKQLTQYMPRQPYILVDTARNHLYVKRSHEVILDALASTGSGIVLDKPGEGNSQWVFDTPRGEFSVQSKLTHPVWVKPDWAFIEEGLMVPKNPADRVEQGVLGEYALGFGKGYFIHGTLYTRLLGKNVTHGCIRLNDNDLKSVYQLARVGTPIMIF